MTEYIADSYELNATRKPVAYRVTAWLLLLTLLFLQACAFKAPQLPEALRKSYTTATQAEAVQATSESASRGQLVITNAPTPPQNNVRDVTSDVAASLARDPKEPVTINVDQMSIKAFVQMVFGNLLKKNVNLDQKLAQRNDLITLKTEGQQTPRQIAETAKLLLQGFGISVIELDSLVRVIPADSTGGTLPALRRGRASADTPAALRPIFHLVELEATRASEAMSWLKTMFGTRIDIQEDVGRNSLLISGTPESVDAALQITRSLDEPRMRGRIAKRLTPAYLGANDLMTRLNEVLTAQGYAVGTNATQNAAIVLIQVGSLNTVYVFTTSQAIAEYVAQWAQELDQPPANSVGTGVFRHEVKYVDAKSLAETFSALVQPQVGTPVQGQAATNRARVVVNAATNSLIIQGGSAEEQRQWRALLAEIDRPIKSALIEVVVAEMVLGAKEQLGVEWRLQDVLRNSGSVSGGTLGGLGIGGSGLSLSFLNGAGQVRGILNALGSASDARILSSPKLIARNSESATIQVGQEVPIVTSQQASTVASVTSTAGILQNIQYRSTGVILRVKPVILAGGRIDLEIMQEVSSAAETRTGVSTSPTISTRKIETKLSLRDGGTVLLGGLISEASSKGNSGVPLLKELPGIGNLFRVDNSSNDKTELIVMITAHVLNDDFETEAITESFKRSLTQWKLPTASTSRSAPAQLQPTAPTVTTTSMTQKNDQPKATLAVPVQRDPGVSEVLPGSAPTARSPAASSGNAATPPLAPGATGASGSRVTGLAAPSASPLQIPPPSSQPGKGDLIDLPGGGQGRLITDPAIFEELRRAAGAK